MKTLMMNARATLSPAEQAIFDKWEKAIVRDCVRAYQHEGLTGRAKQLAKWMKLIIKLHKFYAENA